MIQKGTVSFIPPGWYVLTETIMDAQRLCIAKHIAYFETIYYCLCLTATCASIGTSVINPAILMQTWFLRPWCTLGMWEFHSNLSYPPVTWFYDPRPPIAARSYCGYERGSERMDISEGISNGDNQIPKKSTNPHALSPWRVLLIICAQKTSWKLPYCYWEVPMWILFPTLRGPTSWIKNHRANRKMRHGTNCLMNCLCTDLNNSRSLLHKSSCLLFDDLCLKAGSVYWSRWSHADHKYEHLCRTLRRAAISEALSEGAQKPVISAYVRPQDRLPADMIDSLPFKTPWHLNDQGTAIRRLYLQEWQRPGVQCLFVIITPLNRCGDAEIPQYNYVVSPNTRGSVYTQIPWKYLENRTNVLKKNRPRHIYYIPVFPGTRCQFSHGDGLKCYPGDEWLGWPLNGIITPHMAL